MDQDAGNSGTKNWVGPMPSEILRALAEEFPAERNFDLEIRFSEMYQEISGTITHAIWYWAGDGERRKGGLSDTRLDEFIIQDFHERGIDRLIPKATHTGS